MHGLETVAGIGQRAPDDDAHRVVEIGAAHLLFNIDRNEICAAGRVPSVEGKLGIFVVCHRFLVAREMEEKRLEEAGPIPQVLT
jgi:hypothetical protein